MAGAKFGEGQRVAIVRNNAFGGPAGICRIVSAVPRGAGPQQYRIRGDGEAFDRIMDESRLEAVTYD